MQKKKKKERGLSLTSPSAFAFFDPHLSFKVTSNVGKLKLQCVTHFFPWAMERELLILHPLTPEYFGIYSTNKNTLQHQHNTSIKSGN